MDSAAGKPARRAARALCLTRRCHTSSSTSPRTASAIWSRAARSIAEEGETLWEFSSHYQRAFLLPAIPAVNAEQSLVLPQGWFRRGRIIELYTDGAWQVRLTRVLDSGPDFDRVTFEIC